MTRVPGGRLLLALLAAGCGRPGPTPAESPTPAPTPVADVPVSLEARLADGGPLPARFRIQGLDGTPSPDFDPLPLGFGDNLYVDGAVSVPLPPGRYGVSAMRGPQWSLHRSELTVPPGSPPLEVTAELRPLVDLGGRWCDMHLHTKGSRDGELTFEEVATAAVAEGLDCVAITDHNLAFAMPEPPPRRALELLVVPSTEVTSEASGHYGVIPWPPGFGGLTPGGRSPRELTALLEEAAPDSALILYHPVGPGGLFSLLGTDPQTGRLGTMDKEGDPTQPSYAWHAIELISATHPDLTEHGLRAWMRLLSGVESRATPVGNSDLHSLGRVFPGAGRTFVPDGPEGPVEDAAGLAAALRRGEGVTATNGPALRLSARHRDLSLVVDVPDWMPDFSVRAWTGVVGETGLEQVLDTRLSAMEPISTPTEGWVRRSASVPLVEVPGGERWTVAVIRGEEAMQPWSDARPYAVSAPVYTTWREKIWRPKRGQRTADEPR